MGRFGSWTSSRRGVGWAEGKVVIEKEVAEGEKGEKMDLGL